MLTIKVTLRVFSIAYTLPELKKFLGEPTRGFSIGDIDSRGRHKKEQSFWAFESSSLPGENFETHLNEIIDFLDSKLAVIEMLRDKCEFDIFCMLSSGNGQGSACLPFHIIENISRYHLDIKLDIYGSSSEDD